MWKSKAADLKFSHGKLNYSKHKRFVVIRYFNVEILLAPFSGKSFALFTFARASQNERNVVDTNRVFFCNFLFPPK